LVVAGGKGLVFKRPKVLVEVAGLGYLELYEHRVRVTSIPNVCDVDDDNVDLCERIVP
jgi:hypothetical protein